MKNVSAAIIINNGRILLTRRAAGETHAGAWEFPGGKQEVGESLQECLVRELKEELNIQADCSRILVENVYTYPGGKMNLVAIETVIVSGEISLSVHDQYQWIAIGELLNYQLSPADIPIAEWLIEHYHP